MVDDLSYSGEHAAGSGLAQADDEKEVIGSPGSTAINVLLGAETLIVSPVLTWIWDTSFHVKSVGVGSSNHKLRQEYDAGSIPLVW